MDWDDWEERARCRRDHSQKKVEDTEGTYTGWGSKREYYDKAQEQLDEESRGW